MTLNIDYFNFMVIQSYCMNYFNTSGINFNHETFYKLEKSFNKFEIVDDRFEL